MRKQVDLFLAQQNQNMSNRAFNEALKPSEIKFPLHNMLPTEALWKLAKPITIPINNIYVKIQGDYHQYLNLIIHECHLKDKPMLVY